MESARGASIRVVIVATESLFRRGLRAMLEGEGMEVAAEAATGAEALDVVAALNSGGESIAAEPETSVVLVDVVGRPFLEYPKEQALVVA
jgi:DNA-binding NarL/FixJ family response regulator